MVDRQEIVAPGGDDLGVAIQVDVPAASQSDWESGQELVSDLGHRREWASRSPPSSMVCVYALTFEWVALANRPVPNLPPMLWPIPGITIKTLFDDNTYTLRET